MLKNINIQFLQSEYRKGGNLLHIWYTHRNSGNKSSERTWKTN